jgi:hypothetical protein
MEKFKAISRLAGYSSWVISVTSGSFEFLSDTTIKVYVSSGKEGNDPISNKIFYLPAETTIIEENLETAQRGA